jgi:hypothetical protein
MKPRSGTTGQQEPAAPRSWWRRCSAHSLGPNGARGARRRPNRISKSGLAKTTVLRLCTRTQNVGDGRSDYRLTEEGVAGGKRGPGWMRTHGLNPGP